MPVVRVKSGYHAGEIHKLRNEQFVIGRDPDGDLRVLDHGVSRQHAMIHRVGSMFFVKDLGSLNGTYVNEERITEELLCHGDMVRIGSTVLRFEDMPKKSSGRGVLFEGSGPSDIIDLAEPDDEIAEPPVAAPVQSSYLKVLYELADVIGREQDQGSLLDRIAELAASATAAEQAYIFIKKGERREFSLEAVYEQRDRETPVVSKGIIRQVVKERRAILTSDALLDERFNENPSVMLKGVQSVICAPLIAFGEMRGVLYLATSSIATAFGQEHLELCTAIGIQTGMALASMQSQSNQEKVLLSTVSILIEALELRDPRAVGHTERVAAIANQTAKQLKMNSQERRRLRMAAYLHNVGKLTMQDEEVQAEEVDPIQLERTCDLVQNIEGLQDILEIIRHYRERQDGEGFPDGLDGEAIPLPSKILAVADGLDTVMTLRSLSLPDGLVAIAERTPDEFDPDVVDALIAALRDS